MDSIFTSKREDFLKLFLAPLIVMLVAFTATDILRFALVIFIFNYFFEAGHAYTTFLEVFGDPRELSKHYGVLVFLGAMIVNYSLVKFISVDVFFSFVFHFTYFHYMRQGLGVISLYKKQSQESYLRIKYLHYFLAYMPLVIYFFREPTGDLLINSMIILPIKYEPILSFTAQKYVYLCSIATYLVAIIYSLYFILKNKMYNILMSFSFYVLVTNLTYLFTRHHVQLNAILYASHAIPYYFLMEKRLRTTHSIEKMRKNSLIMVSAAVAVGGLISFTFQPKEGYFSPVVFALLYTPVIAHYVLDGIIWQRNNEYFKKFITG